METDKLYDVAISYASENRARAEALAEVLTRRGITVFYDRAEDRELYGSNLQDRLWDIYRNQARHCVIMVSEHYGDDTWTRLERRAAEDRALSDDEYLLPVRVDGAKIRGILSTFKHVEWPPRDEEYVAELISAKLKGRKPVTDRDEEPLTYLFNYISVIGTLSIPIILAALYPVLEIPRWIIYAALLVFAVCLGWVVYLAQKAYRAFGTTTQIPRPKGLWQIIFNQLPPQKGESYKWRRAVNILVIFDYSTRDILDSISKHYGSDKISIRDFEFGPKFRKEELFDSLNDADAVYFFSTEGTQRENEPYNTVNEWGKSNSHKPVLAVDFLAPDAPYNWTFEHIPQKEAVPGLWKLLVRSTERASQLRKQAKAFRRIWGLTMFIALVSCGLFVGSLFESARQTGHARDGELDLRQQFEEQTAAVEQGDRMDQRDLERLRSFHDSLSPLRDKIQLLLDSQKQNKDVHDLVGVKAREALKSLARYVADDLRRRQKNVDDTGSISFWRKYQDNDKTAYIVEVARSDETREGCFEGGFDPNTQDYPPIVSCALEEAGFVHWRRSLHNNEPASWSKHGKIDGYWKGGEGSDKKAFMELESGHKCRYLERDHPRTGVMCLGADSGSLKSGVCLSTTLVHGFPRQEWTKHYLYQVVSIMQLIPDNVLITEARRSKCRERK